MPNKENLEVEVISKAEHEALMSEFRKENLRLQRLIAKNQVEHESELNRVLAEKEEEIKKVEARHPLITIGLTTAKGGQDETP